MDKTAAGHNMLWIGGDKVGLEVIKILRSMYGDRLVSFSDKADVFVEEIETELIKQFGQVF